MHSLGPARIYTEIGSLGALEESKDGGEIVIGHGAGEVEEAEVEETEEER